MISVQCIGRFLPIFDAFGQWLNEGFHQRAGETFEFLFDGFVTENQTCEGRADLSCCTFGIRG